MKIKTRIVSLILSLAILFTFTADIDFSACAFVRNQYGDFGYVSTVIGCDENGSDIYNDENVKIIKYYGDSSELIIPEKMDGLIVKEIGEMAFMKEAEVGDGYVGNNKIISVFVPDTVDIIWNGAFGSCENLTKVRLSENLIELWNWVFQGCINLSSIVLPSKLKNIGMNCFGDCKSLNSINIPLSVERIGTWAFQNCVNLTDVYYEGSKDDWNNITIGDYNEYLLNARIHYNCVSLPEYSFDDLKESAFDTYIDYVNYTSIYNKFITGTNPPYNTVFEPVRAINRAMMVTILYRMAGEPYANGNPYRTSPFTDITNTSVYYYDAACWALKNGVTTETTFKPFDNVSREQTATFLYRYAQDNGTIGDEAYKNVNLNAYHDGNSISHFAVDAMKWANYNGMITGTQQGYANPQGATQRIHATKILYGFGKTCNIGNFG